MVGQSRVNEIEAKSAMDVRIGQATGNLAVATAQGEKEAAEGRRTMEIQSERLKVEADQQAAVQILDSEANLKAAENDAKALVAHAEADNNSAAGLEVKRKYELEWERLKVLETLASTGRRFVSGAIGASVLKEMVPADTSFTASKDAKKYF